jgi:hypothetical protein
MTERRLAPRLAVGAALLLIASAAGIASAAPLVNDTTTTTWVDTNGNGVADGCEADVLANDAAVTTANAAADLDGDGTISTSEAARTDWIGGPNCNHGGAVSESAKAAKAEREAAREAARALKTHGHKGAKHGNHGKHGGQQ